MRDCEIPKQEKKLALGWASNKLKTYELNLLLLGLKKITLGELNINVIR